MSAPTPELYIHIVPLWSTDHRHLSRKKDNPFQRIKVSNAMTLQTVATYIQRLAATTSHVTLHAPYRGGAVQVPLSMSVAEFLFITNQRDTCELRYSLADEEPVPAPPPDPHRNYPPPIPKMEKSPLIQIPISDSIPGLGHPIFSSSLPPSLDVRWLPRSPDAAPDDLLSLCRRLELAIGKP
jgi:hypothetical protein